MSLHNPLSILVWLPFLAALVVGFLPVITTHQAKMASVAFATISFLIATVGLLPAFKYGSSAFQFEESVPWISSLGISYHFGIDGISLWLVILTTLLSFVAVAFSWYVDKLPRYFMALIFLLEGAMIGAFVSLDLVFFFTFFEMTLIPMWVMIAFWGGEKRSYAANKFLIYTFAGSIFLLVGMIALAIQVQNHYGALSFDIVTIQAHVANGKFWAGALQAEAFCFWAFVAAFLVKSPVFPFHTWVPDTYGESPIAGPILSGAMVKLGSYGFLRFCLPLFPDVAKNQLWILATLAVVGIVYASVVAVIQTDARRMLAYSSISHMGFVLLGIFSLNETGMIGGAYQQLNHGVISCLLFVLVGFLFQRRETTSFAAFGGLKPQMPHLAALFLIAILAGLGLPGTSGFVGEFLAMIGIYQAGAQKANGMNLGLAVAAGFSMIVTAGYMLYMFQQIFYGKNENPINRRLADLKKWEVGLGGILAAVILLGGFGSKLFTQTMEPSVILTQQMVLGTAGVRPTWKIGKISEDFVPAVSESADKSASMVPTAVGSDK